MKGAIVSVVQEKNRRTGKTRQWSSEPADSDLAWRPECTRASSIGWEASHVVRFGNRGCPGVGEIGQRFDRTKDIAAELACRMD